jgi:hypothetical protein
MLLQANHFISRFSLLSERHADLEDPVNLQNLNDACIILDNEDGTRA